MIGIIYTVEDTLVIQQMSELPICPSFGTVALNMVLGQFSDIIRKLSKDHKVYGSAATVAPSVVNKSTVYSLFAVVFKSVLLSITY